MKKLILIAAMFAIGCSNSVKQDAERYYVVADYDTCFTNYFVSLMDEKEVIDEFPIDTGKIYSFDVEDTHTYIRVSYTMCNGVSREKGIWIDEYLERGQGATDTIKMSMLLYGIFR